MQRAGLSKAHKAKDLRAIVQMKNVMLRGADTKNLLVCAMMASLVLGVEGSCTLCDTGAANRTKVICDNSLPWKPCGTDQPADFVLTCAQIEDQAAQCSTCAGCQRKENYQYACCPQDTHPDADCAQGLCAGGVVNRNAVICDNRQAGSPCGSDQHAELVITCGEIHDQITWGHRQNCSQTAADYMTAHPQCCGSLVKVPLPHMNMNIDSHAYRY